MPPTMPVEVKLWELFWTTEHLMLFIGIFAVIVMLKQIKPIGKILFSEKWKWLIAPINLVLSGLGIFVLNLTSFTTTNMKVLMLLATSALVTLTYEAGLKYAIDYITNKIKELMEKNTPK